MRKIKGMCPVCDAQRAFLVTRIEHRTDSVHIIGNLQVHTYPFPPSYEGVCSKGHTTPFMRVYPPKPRMYCRESINELIGRSRGKTARIMYQALRHRFRDLEQEAHYAPNHECSPICPEYNYPEYY